MPWASPALEGDLENVVGGHSSNNVMYGCGVSTDHTSGGELAVSVGKYVFVWIAVVFGVGGVLEGAGHNK